MQPDRVEQVKFLLATAMSKPVTEREAYLDLACAGDLTLRRDVEQYLFAGDKTEQFTYHPEAVDTLEHTARITGDPRVGKQFGKYTIRKRLAEGGMGVVYLAIDNQLGREVALKILPEFFILDKDRLARFHREARATSLLNHPNIVTIFELGQIDDSEFIVTEFVEGETLRAKIDRGQIPFVEMIKIASQVASALGAAHKAGVVHRFDDAGEGAHHAARFRQHEFGFHSNNDDGANSRCALQRSQAVGHVRLFGRAHTGLGVGEESLHPFAHHRLLGVVVVVEGSR